MTIFINFKLSGILNVRALYYINIKKSLVVIFLDFE